MRRGQWLACLGSFWCGFAAWGCGSDSFLPPPPPELHAKATARVPGPAKVIDLILDAPETDDRKAIALMALQESGKIKVSIRVGNARPGDAAASQADLVRKAIDGNSTAVIIEAVDKPEVVQALNEARGKGIKVVLMDRTVTTPEHGTPFPRVTFEAFAEAGKKMVQEAVIDAGKAKLDPKGPAVLLVSDAADQHTAERVASIQDALKAAGVPLLQTLRFNGKAEDAQARLKGVLDANPKIVYVFVEEDMGLAGAYEVRTALGDARTILLAAYIARDSRLSVAAVHVCSAVVDRNLLGLVERSVETAMKLAGGKPVADPVLVPLPFQGASTQPDLPKRPLPSTAPAGTTAGPPPEHP